MNKNINPLLSLHGSFQQENRNSKWSRQNLSPNIVIKKEEINILLKQITTIKTVGQEQSLLQNHYLINIAYNKIIAKSNRIKGILVNNNNDANTTTVGAKFHNEKHIITHLIPSNLLDDTILWLETMIQIFETEFNGVLTADIFNDNKTFREKLKPYKTNITTKKFEYIIHDLSHIERISTPSNAINDIYNDFSNQVITLYETHSKIADILKFINIDIHKVQILDNNTIVADKTVLNLLVEKLSYFIAMSVTDLNQLSFEDFPHTKVQDERKIIDPTNEPIIGVFDTQFDKKIYFHKWVEYHNLLSKEIQITDEDYEHGTAVSSIIVQGHKLNPDLDDGCGYFRVRHFGISTKKTNSISQMMKQIENTVHTHPDIKVWNLSLGSVYGIEQNYVSLVGAKIDELQTKYDVIFVISGTNRRDPQNSIYIGSPADSINSVVVNSVSRTNKSAPYTRKGPVLSFFTKPDVSYYGGDDKGDTIRVSAKYADYEVKGTSYAAPWIARKLAYMIEILNINREVAKALLIDSAIGWINTINVDSLTTIGYGIVPKRIEDIVQNKKDEIKFVITSKSEKYNAYNYRIPVPLNNGSYPFIAKATLCYFPTSARKHGVDYTNDELDIYFGRINNKGTIEDIRNNKQIDFDDIEFINEEIARKNYGKWNNIKFIKDELKTNNRDRKAYNNTLWGLSIKRKTRNTSTSIYQPLKFGVVITLREINGINRIEEFIKLCNINGWIVNKIHIDSQIELFNELNEDIEFE